MGYLFLFLCRLPDKTIELFNAVVVKQMESIQIVKVVFQFGV